MGVWKEDVQIEGETVIKVNGNVYRQILSTHFGFLGEFFSIL